MDGGREAHGFEVAAALAAFAEHALGDGVQRDELKAGEGRRGGVGVLEVPDGGFDALEGGGGEDVFLVDFVSDEEEVAVCGEGDEGGEVGLGNDGAGGVAGVDDDETTGGDAGGKRVVDDAIEGGGGGNAPTVVLVEVVGDGSEVKGDEQGAIDGVEGDGEEDASVVSGGAHVAAAEEGHGDEHTLEGAAGEEDVVREGGEAVAGLDVGGHGLAHARVAVVAAIGTDGAGRLEEGLGTGDGVAGISLRQQLCPGVGLAEFDEFGVLHQRTDLAGKSQWLLTTSLWVSQVERYNAREGPAV